MKSFNYEIFYNFYLENKDKIFMKSGAKSVNEDNVVKWFENIKSYSPENIKDTYLFFAETFIEFLMYVSFNEFYNILNRISIDLNVILRETMYDKIYFYIPDEMNKSNLWVTLLFLDCLLTNGVLNEDIKRKIRYIDNYRDLIIDSNDEKSLCLYCDDMSYTGNQITNNFKLRRPLSRTHIDNYIVIPYISNIAKIKLLSLENTHFFRSTIEVYSYISLLKLRYQDKEPELVDNVLKMFNNDPKFKNGQNACSCEENYTALYFDHKIADELSTFNKLLFTGSYPINPTILKNCKITPLINGCSVEDITDIFNVSNSFENPCLRGMTLDSDIPCFPSFYKTIKYTIDHEEVNNDNSIEILLDRAVLRQTHKESSAAKKIQRFTRNRQTISKLRRRESSAAKKIQRFTRKHQTKSMLRRQSFGGGGRKKRRKSKK
jgi:hypothetical protein